MTYSDIEQAIREDLAKALESYLPLFTYGQSTTQGFWLTVSECIRAEEAYTGKKRQSIMPHFVSWQDWMCGMYIL